MQNIDSLLTNLFDDTEWNEVKIVIERVYEPEHEHHYRAAIIDKLTGECLLDSSGDKKLKAYGKTIVDAMANLDVMCVSKRN
jgi:hypothetical protein